MSPPRIDGTARAVAALALGATLAACSGLYYDRRDTIVLSAGDAVAANAVEQMVDPWPRYSDNRNIGFNGERMQRAVQCYRAGRVTQPADLDAGVGMNSATVSRSGVPCQGNMVFELPPASGAPIDAEARK